MVGLTGAPGVPVLSRVVEEPKQEPVPAPILRRLMVDSRAVGLQQKPNMSAVQLPAPVSSTAQWQQCLFHIKTVHIIQ